MFVYKFVIFIHRFTYGNNKVSFINKTLLLHFIQSSLKRSRWCEFAAVPWDAHVKAGMQSFPDEAAIRSSKRIMSSAQDVQFDSSHRAKTAMLWIPS